MSQGDILVIGPNWVGDAVMSQSLLACLKRESPDVAIDVIAPDWVRPVLRRMPEVREAIASPFDHGELALWRRISFGRSLRGRYTRAYVLPGSWKSAIAPAAARIPRRSGYLKELRFGLLNDIRELPRPHARRTAMAYQGLADESVFSDPARLLRPKLSVDHGRLSALSAQFGIAVGRYVALAPGAEFGPAKRWPASHWAELIEKLSRQGARSVLLGSPRDRETTQAITRLSPSAVDLVGRIPLEDAIDVLAGAMIVVANDSGLMHVAAAVGAPIVAIYGSTSPTHTPPLSERSAIAKLNLNCSPCGKRVCPLGHTNCLDKLEPDQLMIEINGLCNFGRGSAASIARET